MIPSLFNQAGANSASAKCESLSFGASQMGIRCLNLPEQELSRLAVAALYEIPSATPAIHDLIDSHE